MRVAFLFLERSPNYDLDFYLLRQLSGEDLDLLDTYVRVGLWGLDLLGVTDIQKRRSIVRQTLLTGDGNLMGLLLEHDLHVLVTDRIHVVQFNSIPRTFALKLHKKLRNLDNYLCFTQVIPDNKLHQHIFASFIPRYKLEKGKINVLFSAIGDDEWLADEMIEWVKERYSWLSLKVTKYDVESRFSIFDKNTSPENEFLVPKMSHLLKEEWEIQVEIALHKLEDVAPHALTELKSAIDKLSMSKLSPADCAQIAINLRRFLEKIANTLIPPKSNKDKERYKDRLAWYIREKLSRTKYYENHVEAELNDLVNRVEKLYIMSNKGVHEDYSPQAFSIVILRVIILTRELSTRTEIDYTKWHGKDKDNCAK